MDCDFCEQPATVAVESVKDDAIAYLCNAHRAAAYAAADWFEPEVIGPELDPHSGLPLIESSVES